MAKAELHCRAAAAKVIAGVLGSEGSLAGLLPLYQCKVAERDRALLQDLCYGTLRWFPRIRILLDRLLSKPLKSKDNDLLALLAVGIYQLSETRIPDHAALNETVAATRDLQKSWSKALINGVLRNYLRRRDELAATLVGNAQFETAHPDWLLDIWCSAFPAQAAEIVAANNARAPMTLRVNCARTSRDAYLQQLQESGIGAAPTPFSPAGLTLAEPLDVDRLPGFHEGLVSVQDEAAQLAALLLEPEPGEHILDACCAPGGKTCHLLELTGGAAHVTALDIDAQRLPRVQQNLDRLSLSATLLCADAVDTATWWRGMPFDRILLDAPCSATGVIRRHPDIKLLRRAKDIDKLAALQSALLKALWPLLKAGGYLLYATCSTLPEENEQVIETFMQAMPEIINIPIESEWGVARAVGRQLLPQFDGHDGFYYAKLHKPLPA